MKPRQDKNYIAGIYLRLSFDDGRDGESTSIESQRLMLSSFIKEKGWTLHDAYIDDGISGTTFNRPGVQRLLDDAKNGVINTIVVKDLSRFGRNYIQVGQYLDYIFPSFGIRFIALQDNVDTENREGSGMEMMPIMNVFNEWHAANTSKKVKAVLRAKSKSGQYCASVAPYGYVVGSDEKRLPVIDEPAATIVRRIFEMRLKGYSARRITNVLNDENIPSPLQYRKQRLGIASGTSSLFGWSEPTIWSILSNPIYRGDLIQQRTTTISHKNHQRIYHDESECVITVASHEAIVSKKVWEQVQEMRSSKRRGRRINRTGEVHPLSGLLYCADCGAKMRFHTEHQTSYSFNCGTYFRRGKEYCCSHHIAGKAIERIVLEDIRSKVKSVIVDEAAVRKNFIEKSARLTANKVKSIQYTLQQKTKRNAELEELIYNLYTDKVKGMIPEDICARMLAKYSEEQKTLEDEIQQLTLDLAGAEQVVADVDTFISKIKQYMNVTELTREMCLALIDRVVVGAAPKDKSQPRYIQIIYKIKLVA